MIKSITLTSSPLPFFFIYLALIALFAYLSLISLKVYPYYFTVASPLNGIIPTGLFTSILALSPYELVGYTRRITITTSIIYYFINSTYCIQISLFIL